MFFFFNDTATTEISTLPLHDALPIFVPVPEPKSVKNRLHLDLATESAEHQAAEVQRLRGLGAAPADIGQGEVQPVLHRRSEEHTSELQSRPHIVCRLLLEKKKQRDK